MIIKTTIIIILCTSVNMIFSKSIEKVAVIHKNLKLPTIIHDQLIFEISGTMDTAEDKLVLALRSGDSEDFQFVFHFDNQTLQVWPDSEQLCLDTNFQCSYNRGDSVKFQIKIMARVFNKKNIFDLEFRVKDVYEIVSCAVRSFKTTDNILFKGGVEEIHKLSFSFQTTDDT